MVASLFEGHPSLREALARIYAKKQLHHSEIGAKGKESRHQLLRNQSE